MPKYLEITTLGDVSFRLNGTPVKGFSTRKVEALLIYLAGNPGGHAREVLAALFWEEKSQSQAMASLRAALSNLRKVLRPFILADRKKIAINDQAEIWMDFFELERLLQEGHGDAALEMYRGDFLEGFFVRDSSAFESWAAGERDRLRNLLFGGVRTLIKQELESGDYQQAISHAHRLIQIDPLDENARRALIKGLALNGQRSQALAAYQDLESILDQELGVEPDAESRRLYQKILEGRLDAPDSVGLVSSLPETMPPAFLVEVGPEKVSLSTFVQREVQLARLEKSLKNAVENSGQVAFVTGGAGQGKTTLIREFVRCALECHPDLLAVIGNCNAFFGAGDPYLPFGEAMAMLCGDVESAWKSGSISRRHARRLWQALPITAAILAEYGRSLLATMVPLEPFLLRARQANIQLPPQLQAQGKIPDADNSGGGMLDQSQFFEQYTRTLQLISQHHPLLIVLDDLQWGDNASISLLFHLARRIQGSRIMLVCAYRPEEVALGRDGERHPLEKVSIELQRQFGDIEIALGRDLETGGMAFVEAYLDSEPNLLDEEFRQKLFERTAGHPLFTVELLRSMQERGDLVRKNGQWVQGRAVDWVKLPARVEAVIEERLARLPKELHSLLKTACVEGEDFTAEVLSRIQGVSEFEVFSRLIQELGARHRLVDELRSVQVGSRRLHTFHFRHILFQQHLYTGLGEAEREYLHGQVAEVLEKLYGQAVEEISAQLAYHYLQSHVREKARLYLAVAGHRAQASHAHKEAVEYFSQALDLALEDDLAARFDLLLARERSLDLQGNRQEQAADLKTLNAITAETGNKQQKIMVALRRSNYLEVTTDYPEAIQAARLAAELAREIEDQEKEIDAYLAWALAQIRNGEFDEARATLNKARNRVDVSSLPSSHAGLLALMGVAAQEQGDNPATIQHHSEALKIYRQLGDQNREAHSLNTLGNAYFGIKAYKESIQNYEQALTLFQQVGNVLGQTLVMNNLGLVFANQGNYPLARDHYERALLLFERIGHAMGAGSVLVNLGEIATFEEDFQTGRDYFNQALEIAAESENPVLEVYALSGLADCLLKLGSLEEAGKNYSRAMEIREGMGQWDFAMENLAGLARVALARDDLMEAQQKIKRILGFIDQGKSLMATNAPFLIYLTCLQVLKAAGDDRWEEILSLSYRLLNEQAAEMSDDDQRWAFLENLPWHRDIVSLYQKYKG